VASDVRLKEQLPRLTDRIVAGYKSAESIHYLGHCPLPNYEEIVSSLEDLKEILYPGYRRREGLHIGNVTYHVGDLVDGLHDKLTFDLLREMNACVCGDPDEVLARCKAYEATGADLLLCLVNPYNIRHEHVMQTIELMGKHVIPHFDRGSR